MNIILVALLVVAVAFARRAAHRSLTLGEPDQPVQPLDWRRP